MFLSVFFAVAAFSCFAVAGVTPKSYTTLWDTSNQPNPCSEHLTPGSWCAECNDGYHYYSSKPWCLGALHSTCSAAEGCECPTGCNCEFYDAKASIDCSNRGARVISCESTGPEPTPVPMYYCQGTGGACRMTSNLYSYDDSGKAECNDNLDIYGILHTHTGAGLDGCYFDAANCNANCGTCSDATCADTVSGSTLQCNNCNAAGTSCETDARQSCGMATACKQVSCSASENYWCTKSGTWVGGMLGAGSCGIGGTCPSGYACNDNCMCVSNACGGELQCDDPLPALPVYDVFNPSCSSSDAGSCLYSGYKTCSGNDVNVYDGCCKPVIPNTCYHTCYDTCTCGTPPNTYSCSCNPHSCNPYSCSYCGSCTRSSSTHGCETTTCACDYCGSPTYVPGSSTVPLTIPYVNYPADGTTCDNTCSGGNCQRCTCSTTTTNCAGDCTASPKYKPPVCQACQNADSSVGCTKDYARCVKGQCNAQCGYNNDCPLTCTAGGHIINTSRFYCETATTCTCQYPVATCNGPDDLCKTITCGSETYYCTNVDANGVESANYVWRPSSRTPEPGKLCNDKIACTYDSYCHGDGTEDDVNNGVCGGAGFDTPYTCADTYDWAGNLLNGINHNRTCNGNLISNSCTPPEKIYNCSPSNHTLCWSVLAGSYNYGNNVYNWGVARLFSCSNYTLNWAWYNGTDYLKCYDENTCTHSDKCVATVPAFNQPGGKCIGSPVQSAAGFDIGIPTDPSRYLVTNKSNLCIDASNNSRATSPFLNPALDAYGICCWQWANGTNMTNPYTYGAPDSMACQLDTIISGVSPAPECIDSVSCTAFGRLGYIYKPETTACGTRNCPDGTVMVGDCTLTCGTDHQCNTTNTNCQCIGCVGDCGEIVSPSPSAPVVSPQVSPAYVSEGVTNLVIRSPLGTRANQTQVAVTTYVAGQLVCSPAPIVVYVRAGETLTAAQVGECADGKSTYLIDTRVPGNYLITVSFDAGPDGRVTRTASIERFSDEAHQSNVPDFDLSLLPLVAALSLMAARAGARRAGPKRVR